MTFEERGVSGHIDHIAISMITHFVFFNVKYIKKLMLFCISEKEAAGFRKDYFIYVPTGNNPSKVDKLVNTSSVYDIRVAAMKQHKSQLKDVESILGHYEVLPKREHFLVVKK